MPQVVVQSDQCKVNGQGTMGGESVGRCQSSMTTTNKKQHTANKGKRGGRDQKISCSHCRGA